VSLRRRIALLAGGAVAVAILLASWAAYLLVREELRGQVDASLTARVAAFTGQDGPGPGALGGLRGPGPRGERRRGPHGGGLLRRPERRRGGTDFLEQVVVPGGRPVRFAEGDALPVGPRVVAVAGGEAGGFTTDTRVGGERVRMLVAPVQGGGAVQVARSLAEVDGVLARLRVVLLLVALGGIALAAVLGRLVAGRAVEPLGRLTRTAEEVADTQDLGRRIDLEGPDEIGRLATSFNAMLAALQRSMTRLDRSLHAQRQLIADASHELRTPVTSLRTNLEVLQANPGLDPGRREQILGRATAQAEELTVLMADLIDLARGDAPDGALEPVRLDELVEEAIERSLRHAPDQPFHADLAPATVLASPTRLARAVHNLLDNAVAWGGGRPIDVRLRGGELTVRDRGPGFDPGEVEHVFDRFFRGAHARLRPGSGLGLSIVRQVAEAHAGTVAARNAEGGGAEVVLRLPAQGPDEVRPRLP
jgi:two-component system sensor histidine kinase MprB